mgnify:CR=1 FL=1
MLFPDYRPRRLRQNNAFRRMIRETRLATDDLILPLFAVNGQNVQNPIPSMPDQYQLSIDRLVKTARQAAELGLPAVLLFGVPDKKDELATGAYARNGIVQRAIKAVKDALPDLAVISDVCLCQYTSHGHCGVVEGRMVANDATLDLLARTALSPSISNPTTVPDPVSSVRSWLFSAEKTSTASVNIPPRRCWMSIPSKKRSVSSTEFRFLWLAI